MQGYCQLFGSSKGQVCLVQGHHGVRLPTTALTFTCLEWEPPWRARPGRGGRRCRSPAAASPSGPAGGTAPAWGPGTAHSASTHLGARDIGEKQQLNYFKARSTCKHPKWITVYGFNTCPLLAGRGCVFYSGPTGARLRASGFKPSAFIHTCPGAVTREMFVGHTSGRPPRLTPQLCF